MARWAKNNHLTLRSKSHGGHYGTLNTALWSYTHIPNIIDLSQDKNAMVQTRKYYLKNNYLTLRSKVKVPGRSLWYTTPPYGHAPIPNIIDLSQKKQLFDSKVKGQGPIKVIMVCDTPPYGHAPTYQISLTHLERNNYLTLRSRSHEGHYGTRHTALWSCTHIRNIIDLSWKTKKLWSGQASLSRSGSGRSGRKNQTKTICLPSFEGET